MKFEFLSSKYQKFLWIVLILILLLDAYSISVMFSQPELMPRGGGLLFIFGGVILKLLILISLILKKGPIKPLVAIWATFFILSGASGLIALLLSNEPIPITVYADKALFVLIGLGLVFPLNKSIKILKNA